MNKGTTIKNESQAQKWEAVRLKSRIDITKKDAIPPVCLSIVGYENTSIIGTLGNISMILGAAKARKSYLASAITAAFLTNTTILNFHGSLPNGKRKIIYADTEQGNFHTRRIYERILKMSGLPIDQEPENIEFLRLRSYNYQEIQDLLEYIIYHTDNVGVLVLDGVRDLVKDINSSEEGAKIARLLMKWSDEQQIHILTVLHQNKGDGNARGHIGSEFSNKAETVIKVEKKMEAKEKSIVSSHLMRDIDFESFSFSINENDFPEITETSNPANLQKSNPLAHDDDFHRNTIETMYTLKTAIFTGNEFKDRLINVLPDHYKISEKPARRWIEYYIEKGFIKNNSAGKQMKLKLP